MVIDGTPDNDERTPNKFREVQWTRLPDGIAPLQFVERVARLLSSDLVRAAEPVRPGAADVSGSAAGLQRATSTARTARRVRPLLLVLAAVAVTSLGYFALDRLELSKRSTVATRPSLPAADSAASSPSAIPEKSIAVLPFLDMSEKKDQEYFSDGLSKELLDLLAQVPELRVPARTSSFYFKGKQVTVAQIAKALGVAHVLEGSVRKAGSTRVTVQLIRADNGYHMWSTTYDRDLKDLFTVQDEIATAVVAALKIQLLPTQHFFSANQTTSPEAHDAYLLGWQLHFRGDVEADRRAIAAFQKALAADPDYAPAYVGLGMATISLPSDAGDLEAPAYQDSIDCVERAIKLAPDLSIAYSARGIFRLEHSDWAGAHADIAKAVALDPRDSQAQRYLGRYLASQGLLTEAIAATRRAIESDPLDVWARLNLANFLEASHDYNGARDAIHRALEINPDAFILLYTSGNIELMRGQPAESLRVSQQITVGARRGEQDRAFDWLERAYALRDDRLEAVKYDRRLSSLRADPRYRAFLRKINLPE